MEIILKEGEEIRIKSEEGTSEAYMDVVCFKDCILKKSDAEVINQGNSFQVKENSSFK